MTNKEMTDIARVYMSHLTKTHY